MHALLLLLHLSSSAFLFISVCTSSFLSLCNKLRPFRPPPISSALWAASSLRQTAPFMKSVTWAGLHRPGDYAALPLTAQVLQELEECLSSSILCLLPHSCSFIIIFFLSSESRLSVRSSSRPAFSPPPHIPALAERGPWIWAVSAVSNLLMLCLLPFIWVEAL